MMTSVPVTDAFDHSDSLTQLEVELTPEQVDWLEQTADERGVSVGHVLRTVLTAQMRTEPDASSPMKSGDGAPLPFADETTGTASSDEDEDENLLTRLRSTKEKLKDFFEEEASGETEQVDDVDRTDTSKRQDAASGDEASSLFPHLEEVPESATSSGDEPRDAGSSPETEEEERSMFDMVEE